MQWMVPEEKLGRDQNEVIEEISKIGNKTIWIQGHAGSGKSVVLIQSIKDYLANNPNAKICVVVFTRALKNLIEEGLKQVPQLDGVKIPVFTIYGLYPKIMNGQVMPFDAIFCDEVQDLPITFIVSMRKACKHFIIAGDAAQSIYTAVPEFISPSATVDEIKTQINPIEKELNTIYRLSKNIVAMLRNVFPQLLDDLIHINKENTQIRLFKSTDLQSEIAFAWKDAKTTKEKRPEDTVSILISEREKIADFVNEVLALNDKPIWKRELDNTGALNFGSMNRHLETNNIPLMYLGNRHGTLSMASEQNKVIIMTYHSSKGLDFNYVYLPMSNQSMYIHENIKALLLVALSRSKGGLTISYTHGLYAGLIPFLRNIESKSIDDNNQTNEITL
jgi:superfamily I DNA/RNA helicase